MDVESVADVRRLGTCCYCKKLGQRGDGLIEMECQRTPSGRVKSRTLAHPKCYINHFGVTHLLAYVPVGELGTIRLGDVPSKTLKAIMHRLKLSRRLVGRVS